MNNSMFGKTMENIRNRTDIKFARSDKLMNKYAANPLFTATQIINENLVAVQLKKTITLLNKPIYVGMCILDLSKLHMYTFHYDYIIPKYGKDATLLFTDTDSLCYKIKTDDVYEDMKARSELFDMSEYSEFNKFFDKTNKKVVGKMKDETNDYIMTKYTGIRAKAYAFTKEINHLFTDEQKKKFTSGELEKKTLKGIKKSVVKKEITYNDYENCVLNGVGKKNNMKTFRSYKHNIFTVDICKTSLNCFDNKRYILSDKVSTLAHGHFLAK